MRRIAAALALAAAWSGFMWLISLLMPSRAEVHAYLSQALQ